MEARGLRAIGADTSEYMANRSETRATVQQLDGVEKLRYTLQSFLDRAVAHGRQILDAVDAELDAGDHFLLCALDAALGARFARLHAVGAGIEALLVCSGAIAVAMGICLPCLDSARGQLGATGCGVTVPLPASR